MLNVRFTPHLLGIEVEGDYDELNRLYDAVWTVVGDYAADPSIKQQDAIIRERTLALCYDLRHAYMGSRNVRMEDNGMDREKAAWLGISLPPLKNVNYSVEILYPEAIFEVMVLSHLLLCHQAKLLHRKTIARYDASDPRIVFDPTTAVIRMYQQLVMEAVRTVAPKNTFSRIRKMVAEEYGNTCDMYTQWLDVVNCDWCALAPDKRTSKLYSVVRDLCEYAQSPDYRNMKSGIDEYVRQSGTQRNNVTMRGLEYPEDYEW